MTQGARQIFGQGRGGGRVNAPPAAARGAAPPAPTTPEPQNPRNCSLPVICAINLIFRDNFFLEEGTSQLKLGAPE